MQEHSSGSDCSIWSYDLKRRLFPCRPSPWKYSGQQEWKGVLLLFVTKSIFVFIGYNFSIGDSDVNVQIALLDYGQVKEFSTSLRLDYANLVLALNARNPFEIARCFKYRFFISVSLELPLLMSYITHFECFVFL